MNKENKIMNNEIKEILNKLKDRDETYQFCKQYKLALNDWIYEAHYLLVHITNLQQEINKLTTESTEWESKCYDLQEAKDSLQNDYQEAVDKITNLQQEKDNLYLDNTLLKLEKDIYKQGYEELKELIEKVITEVN